VAELVQLTAGSIDITPLRPAPLAGWRDRAEYFERVSDPLEINGILLRDRRVAALLLSVDALYVGGHLLEAIEGQLERVGLANCVVLAAASHTHYAPALDATKPALGLIDDQYAAQVQERASTLVERLANWAPDDARLCYGSGSAVHAVNRRRLGWHMAGGLPRRAIGMRANPSGPNDQSIHLVRFDGEDGQPLAVLWSYACHPVAFPRPLEVTADFPGVVRHALRAQFGSDLPVLFLQGFSGDLRPPAMIPPGRHPKRRMKDVLQGPSLGRFSEADYAQWSGSLARIVSGVASGKLTALAPAVRCATVRVPLGRLIEGGDEPRELTISRFELADTLQLLALSAEVVVEYGTSLTRLFPELQSIPVGCAGDVYGYLPTQRMVGEGGYEAEDFLESFGLAGRFRPTAEQAVTDAMREFAAVR
jgi:hypothetical protein